MLMAELKSALDKKANKIIHGTNTKAGRLFDLILLGLILLSVLLVMMETVSEFDLKYHSYLVENGSSPYYLPSNIFLESFQLIGRGNTSLFYGIIDLLAILPMYLSIFFLGTSIMTVVRSLRLLRLFKIKTTKNLQVNPRS
jgi:voltage-gated potassium channel